MKQESWATPYKKEDLTGKMTHAEAIVALQAGKTVKRGGVVLKLDSDGKVNHTFTTEELHSNQWELTDAPVEPKKVLMAPYIDLASIQDIVKEVTDDSEAGSTEEDTETTEEEEAGKEEEVDTTDEEAVAPEKPVKGTRKPRTKKVDV